MSSFQLFHVAGSALSAQNLRLNTVASNLANADTVASSPQAAYRALQPVFRSTAGTAGTAGANGVAVGEIARSTTEPEKLHQPGHPQADAEGYVYASNVNVVEEMANMISAARSYRSNLELMNTAKDLMLRTLNVGR